MKISECSYCGVFAITEQDACETCQNALGLDLKRRDENVGEANQTNFAAIDRTSSNPNAGDSSQTQQINTAVAAFPQQPSQQWQPPLDANCLRCGTPVVRGQSRCFECDNGTKKGSFPFAILGTILAVMGVFVFGFFVYQYISNPSAAMLRKYAAVTGADDSIIFNNFAISGNAKMVISRYSTPQVMFDVTPTSGPSFPAVEEEFAFSMIFQKPDKTSLEFTKNDSTGSYTAFKQVFDGVSGWKFTNVRNQSPRYEDSQDAFAEKKMGMGLEDYDSVEVVELKDEKIRSKYGGQSMDYIYGLSTFYIEGAVTFSEKKVIVQVKKKHNGKTDDSLLYFDEKTGFMLGMVKKTLVDGEPVITTIMIDNYKKIPAKKKTMFGTEDKTILIPSRWSIETPAPESANGNQLSVTIYLNVEQVETDAEISDEAFRKPLGK